MAKKFQFEEFLRTFPQFTQLEAEVAALREQLAIAEQRLEESRQASMNWQAKAVRSDAALRQKDEALEEIALIIPPKPKLPIVIEIREVVSKAIAIQPDDSALNAVIEAETAEQDLPSAATLSAGEQQSKETGGIEREWNEAQTWLRGLAKFGPDLTTLAHVKARHEAAEFADTPTPQEAADLLICIAGTAIAQHWTLAQLVDAMRDKVEVNRMRTWEQATDGTWQHSNRNLSPGSPPEHATGVV